MIFSSMLFLWLFLPIFILIYYIIDKKYKNVFLVIASFIFYGWSKPSYLILILLVILISYFSGILIYRQDNKIKRKYLLIVSLIVNLGILAYFKYFNFVASNLNSLIGKEIMGLRDIILPLGISFYMFQSLSYLIDIYRSKNNNGEIKVQTNIVNLALYIVLFMKVTQGPIIKYHDFYEQIENRESNVEKTAYGIKRFILGLSKKVLLANTLGLVADDIFALSTNDITTTIAWLGIVCYTLQIYFDFSGYSDMAIGLGEMFGFTFIENFNYPYLSKSIQEFWRRWHISLSTWFKEYLYIPLGGNRKGNTRTYVNLIIVFFITGLWHGSSWNFIFWGIFHGIFLVIERVGFGKLLEKNKLKVLNHIYAILVVMVGWVFFRADNLKYAIEYIYKMFIPTNVEGLYNASFFINKEVLLVLVISILLSGVLQKFIPKIQKIVYERKETNSLSILVLVMLLFICIVSVANGTYNPFIYFKF